MLALTSGYFVCEQQLILNIDQYLNCHTRYIEKELAIYKIGNDSCTDKFAVVVCCGSHNVNLKFIL